MHYVGADKKIFIPALLGAAACLLFQRSGLFSLFFMVPLGFVAFRYNYRIAWIALLLAVAGNAILALSAAFAQDFPAAGILLDILFFTVMAAIFVWIAAPPPFLSANAPAAVRLVAGSCLGALLFAGIFFNALASPEISGYISSWIDSLKSLYASSSPDVVQNALLESLSAEMVVDAIKAVMLRGGSLISCVLLFSVCRQLSLALARLSRRERGSAALIGFRVYSPALWVFSGSFLLVVLTRMAKIEILEIVLWNVLVLCGILYLAQGLGILQFFLAKTSSAFLRLFLHALFIVLLFSPGINAFLLGGVALLGIAENWVPFRAPKQNGPPSTPEAGDGEG